MHFCEVLEDMVQLQTSIGNFNVAVEASLGLHGENAAQRRIESAI